MPDPMRDVAALLAEAEADHRAHRSALSNRPYLMTNCTGYVCRLAAALRASEQARATAEKDRNEWSFGYQAEHELVGIKNEQRDALRATMDRVAGEMRHRDIPERRHVEEACGCCMDWDTRLTNHADALAPTKDKEDV